MIRMPVIIQSPFNSAVVEANLDIFTRSYTEEENMPIRLAQVAIFSPTWKPVRFCKTLFRSEIPHEWQSSTHCRNQPLARIVG